MKQTIIVIIALLLGAARAAAEGRIIDLSTYTADIYPSDIVLYDGDVLTGRLDAVNRPVRVSIVAPEEGADPTRVTLCNVTIEGVNSTSYPWAGITCEGSATITLDGENIVRGFYFYYPGIFVPAGSTLTIGGTGTLEATPFDGGNTNYSSIAGVSSSVDGGEAAGIGGGYQMDCGKIVITGGTITAKGGYFSAGIGSGYEAACKGIEITGGTITATGGDDAAAIGCGFRGTCTGGITITDGVTKLTATRGYGSYRRSFPIIGPSSSGGNSGTVSTPTDLPSSGDTYTYVGPSIALTPNDTRNVWTLDAMPGGNVELTAEYYPYAHVVAPTASENIMFGADAPIVSGASASGGTLKYAVTPATATTAPADGWSTDAPVANQLTSAGKLKVWYYAEGDDYHSDTAPAVPVDVLVYRNIPGGGDYMVATMSEGLTTSYGLRVYLPLSYEPGASEITLTRIAGAPQGRVVILGGDPEGDTLPDEILLLGAPDDESDLNASYDAALEAMDKKHFAITDGKQTLGKVITDTSHTPSDAVVMVLSGGKFRAVDISDGDLDLNAKPGLLLFILSKWEYMQVGTKTSGAATRGIAIAGGGGGATTLTPVPSPTGEGSNAQWYDIQGRRIDKPARKGVYIHHGKKVVIK